MINKTGITLRKIVGGIMVVMLVSTGSGCGSDNGEVTGDGDADVLVETDDGFESWPDIAPDEDIDAADMEDIADTADAPDTVDVPDDAADVEPDGPVVVEWDISVIDDSPAFKSRAALAMDGDGNLAIAYNVATDPEGWYTPSVWYATNAGGEWDARVAAPADGISNEYPNVVFDSENKPHIFYNRYNPDEEQIDIFHVTLDDGLNFTEPENVTQTTGSGEFAPALAMDGDDTIHLLFQVRTGNPEMGYVYSIGYQTFSDSVATEIEEVTAESAFPGLNPAYDLEVDGDGNVHALFCRPGDWALSSVLHYRKRGSGGWETEERMIGTDQDIFSPSIDVDGSGIVHIVYVRGPDLSSKTLQYNRLVAGDWAGEQALSSSIDDRSYYLGLLADDAGGVHIAFLRFFDGNSDVFYIRGMDGLFGDEERVTETVEPAEGTPSIAVDSGGTVYISLTENLSDAPNGKVYLATRREVPE